MITPNGIMRQYPFKCCAFLHIEIVDVDAELHKCEQQQISLGFGRLVTILLVCRRFNHVHTTFTLNGLFGCCRRRRHWLTTTTSILWVARLAKQLLTGMRNYNLLCIFLLPQLMSMCWNEFGADKVGEDHAIARCSSHSRWNIDF